MRLDPSRTTVRNLAPRRDGAIGKPRQRKAEVEDEARPAGLSDDALARRFTQRHHADLRYCAEHAAWYLYDAGRWRKDSTLHAFELARAVCRDAQADLADCDLKAEKRERLLAQLGSAKTVAAVERLSRGDRVHAIRADQLDAHDWLLNTPAGEVDLRTGRLHPHDPNHLHTKCTAVAPDNDAGCPTWLRFLERVTAGDATLIDYLQAVAGYALVGVVSEHMLLFLWGTGANGKSTFSNVITGLMGDYATTAPMDVFTEQPGQAHPTELAMLAGARLVTATETSPGRRWASDRIKALTGGDPITARFMRADFFTYTPRFLLILSGNHRPTLGAVDEAIRRRLHMVPFNVHIPPAERDPNLADKLRAEWPGILAWMIQGVQRWQRDGLSPPASVSGASQEYMEAEDTIGLWLEAATEASLHDDVPSAKLYEDYRNWCDHTGERALPQKRLVSALEDRGYQRTRTKHARVFERLRLRPVAERPWIPATRPAG